MRRDVVNDLLLDARFVYQADTALRQVTQPAVQQPARTAARAEGKVVLLDQPDPQPAHRRIPGDARPDDAATDDENVQRRFCQRAQSALALLGRSASVSRFGACPVLHFGPFFCRAARSRSPNSASPETTKSGAGE